MNEETVKRLKRRYIWGVFWSAVFAVSAVAAIALVADTAFWTHVVKPAPTYARVIIAALLIAPAVYIVSILITRRSQDYQDAKRRYESEHTKG
ncbi:MAG: hypothetical protein MJE12_27025 [Alphaproteobacteria bacterium]|nr:hypothetical protein [Alphaproteobacteria bacterium]